MVSVRNHPPFSPHQSIELLGEPDIQPFDCPAERNAVLGLDQDVEMVTKNRPLADSCSKLLPAGFQCPLYGSKTLAPTEAYHVGPDSDGDMLRVVGLKLGARNVG